MFDERNNAEYVFGIQSALSGTTPVESNIVDMQGWESLTWVAFTGTVTDAGTAAGIVFEVQESDTTADADFTAVADSDLIGSEADMSILLDTDDRIVNGTIGYRGGKQYVRLVATGSTGSSANLCAVAIKRRGGVMGEATIAADIAAT